MIEPWTPLTRTRPHGHGPRRCAYADAAFPQLTLFSLARRGVLAVAGGERGAGEIARTLVGPSAWW